MSSEHDKLLPNSSMSAVERIKQNSDYLRGTLSQSLATPLTRALAPDDTQLCKFHGFYQQDDRDQRARRLAQRLEPLFSFMLRICVPGGVMSTDQWLALDQLADKYGDGGLRITTRQAVQLHGVIKSELRSAICDINRLALSTLAACGDVNRNVMAVPLLDSPRVEQQVRAFVSELSRALAPQTRAYHELWIDQVDHAQSGPSGDQEPLYGPTYLPRKFKCGVTVPPHNDVDIATQDLGFVGIAEHDELVGFNVLVGGGMGRSHGDDSTFARLASSLGFVERGRAVEVAKAVLLAQRDLGNRSQRHQARLKYTLARLGVDRFRSEVEARQGFRLGPLRPVSLGSTGDPYGWFDRGGYRHLALHIPSGRVRDTDEKKLRSALVELMKVHEGELRLTGNQNLLLTQVTPASEPALRELLNRHQLLTRRSGLRLSALACVALPTCSLAMAEAERYLPQLLQILEEKLRAHGLWDERISLRITGCPNGCARPYAAEIGLVGRASGLYELYLGGNREGTRLAECVERNIREEALVELLDDLFAKFSKHRQAGEGFGEFWHRQAQRS